jgi:hypothetical protein
MPGELPVVAVWQGGSHQRSLEYVSLKSISRLREMDVVALD